MKKYFNICVGLLLSSFALTTTSCRDEEWDDHYKKGTGREESECLVINELESLGYAQMAKQYIKTGLDTVLNSGLQYTIFALPDDSVAKMSGMSESDMRSILMNMTFFGSKDFPDSLVNISMLNEKIVFERKNDEAFIHNYHDDTIMLNMDKMNQRIYSAVVHEVPTTFVLNENFVSFFQKQDSVYSRMLKHFSWDTLYYADGSQQKVPVFENGTITLANSRQLKFQLDSTIRANAELKVMDAEKMEFLMTKDVRAKLNKLYEDLYSDKAKTYFKGFDAKSVIEPLIARDSMVYFISKAETKDSMKICYFEYPGDSKRNEYMRISKDQIEVKQLTGGNKVYFVDTLLMPSKYLTMLDSSIIEKEVVNVASQFVNKGWGDGTPRPAAERYFSIAPDLVGTSTSSTYWKGEIATARGGWGRINIVNSFSVANYPQNAPKKGDYFQFRFDKEHFNTRTYQLSMIVSPYNINAQKNSGSFKLSIETVVGKDSISIPLYALTHNGDTVQANVAEGTEKGELDLTLLDNPDFEEVSVDFDGAEVSAPGARRPVYKVTFAPFTLEDYTKDVYVRFTLNGKPYQLKKDRLEASYVDIHSFQFEMLKDKNNPVEDGSNNE